MSLLKIAVEKLPPSQRSSLDMTCKNGALAVSIGHFPPHISERLAAPGHDNTMVGRRKLSLLDRGRVVAWFQDGVAVREITRRLQVSPSVIVRLRQRLNATDQVQNRPRPGRPKTTTAREETATSPDKPTRRGNPLQNASAGNCRRPPTPASPHRPRGTAHAAQLRARRPAKWPKLTPARPSGQS